MFERRTKVVAAVLFSALAPGPAKAQQAGFQGYLDALKNAASKLSTVSKAISNAEAEVQLKKEAPIYLNAVGKNPSPAESGRAAESGLKALAAGTTRYSGSTYAKMMAPVVDTIAPVLGENVRKANSVDEKIRLAMDTHDTAALVANEAQEFKADQKVGKAYNSSFLSIMTYPTWDKVGEYRKQLAEKVTGLVESTLSGLDNLHPADRKGRTENSKSTDLKQPPLASDPHVLSIIAPSNKWYFHSFSENIPDSSCEVSLSPEHPEDDIFTLFGLRTTPGGWNCPEQPEKQNISDTEYIFKQRCSYNLNGVSNTTDNSVHVSIIDDDHIQEVQAYDTTETYAESGKSSRDQYSWKGELVRCNAEAEQPQQ